jgi:hypothetical protein
MFRKAENIFVLTTKARKFCQTSGQVDRWVGESKNGTMNRLKQKISKYTCLYL